MDKIHVHKTKKSICAHFAESPCKTKLILILYYNVVHFDFIAKLIINRLFKLKVGTKIVRLQTASDEAKTHSDIKNN